MVGFHRIIRMSQTAHLMFTQHNFTHRQFKIALRHQ
ncbi:Uncharacterised protein [Vibrio cholerae]|nr:Uncharacterised protein [Vibrio cholerae]